MMPLNIATAEEHEAVVQLLPARPAGSKVLKTKSRGAPQKENPQTLKQRALRK
jgi:hypothetical protein